MAEGVRDLHYSFIVIDGCAFFYEGYSQYMAQAGVTALSITVAEPDDDLSVAVERSGSQVYLGTGLTFTAVGRPSPARSG